MVVHLDYPWNPARLDQRVGRVRRLGSRHDVVTVYALAPPASAEWLLRIDERLRDKLRVAQRTIGVAGHILPSLVPLAVEHRGAAEAATDVRNRLRSWIERGAALACSHGGRAMPVVAAVASDADGGDRARRPTGRPAVDRRRRRRASTRRPPPSTRRCRAACGPTVDVHDTAFDAAIQRIDRWLEARFGASAVELPVVTASRARRVALVRVARALSRAPRHRRALLAPLVHAARSAAVAPLAEGAERVLESLVGVRPARRSVAPVDRGVRRASCSTRGLATPRHGARSRGRPPPPRRVARLTGRGDSTLYADGREGCVWSSYLCAAVSALSPRRPRMQYTTLGHTGLTVSRLCLGCMSYGDPRWRTWVLDEGEAQPFFRLALDSGINFFDTADMYSLGVSEEVTGRALRAMANLDEIVIATKVFWPMSDAPNRQACRASTSCRRARRSLRRLGVETIDLYQIHRFDHADADRGDARRARPTRAAGQGALHRRQLRLRVGADARAQRLRAKRVGAVRLDAEALQPALSRRRARDDSALPHGGARAHSVVAARARRADASAREDQGLDGSLATPTCTPTGSTRTPTGRSSTWSRGSPKARGISMAQVALAWVLSKPDVTAPIIGATRLEHLEEAIAALDVKLTAEEIADARGAVHAEGRHVLGARRAGQSSRAGSYSRCPRGRSCCSSIRAHVFQRRIASSLPAGRIFSAFSYQRHRFAKPVRRDLRRAERAAVQLRPRATLADDARVVERARTRRRVAAALRARAARRRPGRRRTGR